jgi:hypothetical protein
MNALLSHRLLGCSGDACVAHSGTQNRRFCRILDSAKPVAEATGRHATRRVAGLRPALKPARLFGTKSRFRRFEECDFLVRKRLVADKFQIRTWSVIRAKTCALRLTKVHVTHVSQLRDMTSISPFRRFSADSTKRGFSKNQRGEQHNIDLFRICDPCYQAPAPT